MKRILCIMGKVNSGGVESMVFSYYTFLDKSKYQFDFVYESDSENDIPERLLNMGAKSFKVPPMSKPFSYIKSIKKIIKTGGYDIIHCNTNTLSVLPLFAARSCKVKYRILHNHSTSSPAEKKRDLIKKILRPMCRKLSNCWCACSRLSAAWMYGEKALNENRVTVLNNAVDCERFLFDEKSREDIRNELGVGDKKVLGHIGRFMTQKNHLFLIDIFAEYRKFNKNSVLVLCGNGPLSDKVREYAAQKGVIDSVIFTGVRKDVHKLYSAFDVFLLPSLYEGLPVVSVEACAAGLPMILSDCITEECKLTDSVYYLPINDPGIWAKTIDRLPENDRNKTSAMMKDGDFNMRNAVKTLEKLYDSLTL